MAQFDLTKSSLTTLMSGCLLALAGCGGGGGDAVAQDPAKPQAAVGDGLATAQSVSISSTGISATSSISDTSSASAASTTYASPALAAKAVQAEAVKAEDDAESASSAAGIAAGKAAQAARAETTAKAVSASTLSTAETAVKTALAAAAAAAQASADAQALANLAVAAKNAAVTIQKQTTSDSTAAATASAAVTRATAAASAASASASAAAASSAKAIASYNAAKSAVDGYKGAPAAATAAAAAATKSGTDAAAAKAAATAAATAATNATTAKNTATSATTLAAAQTAATAAATAATTAASEAAKAKAAADATAADLATAKAYAAKAVYDPASNTTATNAVNTATANNTAAQAAATAAATSSSTASAAAAAAKAAADKLASSSTVGSGGTTTPTSPSTTTTSAGLNIGSCVASGKGKDYQVGEGAGQLASLDDVPWASLAAGDTVRIFYKSTPYRGKFIVGANGTSTAPVRICGVKSSTGQRPIIDGSGATTRRGLPYGDSTNTQWLHQTRSIIVVKPLYGAAWTAYPTYVQIDGLEIRGAHPNYTFTDTDGTTRRYVAFGACVWLERGHNITIADNVIHDCSQGIYSKSTDDGEFAQTKNIRVAGNYIYDNGIVGDVHMHNTYMASLNITYEFNRYGPPKSGALGNAIKDRSVGTVVRYNHLEEGAHALDLVEAEDFPVTAQANAAYRSTYVYGNRIVKTGDSGSVIHYGGDHFGAASATSPWGEPIFRQGTLYFYNNSVHVKGSQTGALFQLSTTKERAEIWNNVFSFASTVPYPALRMNQQDVSPLWTPGGVLNLGKNWIDARWADSDPWHPIPGTVTGTANMITGSTAPYDLTTFVPLSGSALIDATQANLAAVANYPVQYQLDASFKAVSRVLTGTKFDLGAMER